MVAVAKFAGIYAKCIILTDLVYTLSLFHAHEWDSKTDHELVLKLTRKRRIYIDTDAYAIGVNAGAK